MSCSAHFDDWDLHTSRWNGTEDSILDTSLNTPGIVKFTASIACQANRTTVGIAR